MRGGLQQLLWFALLLELNSSVFFSPTNKFLLSNTEFREIYVHFHSHGSLFCIPMRATSHLASFSSRNFGTISLKSENSEVAYCNVSKEMQNNEHMDIQTDEKMKAQTTRQTVGKKIISKWALILSMKLHEMIFP